MMTENELPQGLVAALQTAFEASLKKSPFEVLGPGEACEDGIEYRLSLYDPFSGTVRGDYLFSWDEIETVIKDGVDWSLHEEISMSISEFGESDGGGEFVVDEDGRVHDRDVFEE